LFNAVFELLSFDLILRKRKCFPSLIIPQEALISVSLTFSRSCNTNVSWCARLLSRFRCDSSTLVCVGIQ